MDWKEIAGAVGKYAPILGTLVGGPAGTAIGSVIASALGTEATPDAVSQALAVNPDAAVKLRQIESDERVKLQSMVIAHADNELAASTAALQATVEDRKSARTREVDTKDSATPRWLACGVTLGFFGVLAWLLAVGKPAQGGDALLVMLGSLGTAWTAVISYYYGSSAGSDRKTELMDKARAS